MGKPKPIRSSAPLAPRALRDHTSRAEDPSAFRRRGRRARTVLALRNCPLDDSGRCGTACGIRAASVEGVTTRLLALVLSALLAVTMLPAAGLQGASAYADEPVERPATSGGDVALEGANKAAAAASPVAEEREGGMLVADGLLYTVADGGLALVGFDEGASLEGALAVPAAVSVDGRDVAVVAVDLAEGQAAPGVVSLSLPQSIKDIRIETLAAAFPSLLSVEVASGQGSTLPAAAGAAALRATYSSFEGLLLERTSLVSGGTGGEGVEAVACREVAWAPPALRVARIPADVRSAAPGSFVDAAALEAVECLSEMRVVATAQRDDGGALVREGAFSDGQLASVAVVVPESAPAVSGEGGRVSASAALVDASGQGDRRQRWLEAGFPEASVTSEWPEGLGVQAFAALTPSAEQPSGGQEVDLATAGVDPAAEAVADDQALAATLSDSEDLIAPYASTSKTLRLGVTPTYVNIPAITVKSNTNVSVDRTEAGHLGFTSNQDISPIYWGAYVARGGELNVSVYNGNNSRWVGGCTLAAPSGWSFVSTAIEGYSHGVSPTESGEYGGVVLARSETVGNYPLLTTNSLAGTGSALTAARSDHNHDSAYAKLADFNALKTTVGNKLDSSAISSYNTNAKLDAKFDTKVDASDFGTITYSGLDGSDSSVYPTSYRKGGTPALPTPKREGFKFTGWTWAGQAAPTTDADVIKGAFADAGTVALAANWEEAAPEANCFFADAALDSATGGAWESVITVKLTDDASKTSVTGIRFAVNDLTGLLSDASGVRFAVGGSRDGLSAPVGFDGAAMAAVPLADVDGGKGVYVKVTIPAGGIDRDRIVGLKGAGDYIASLARMTYTNIA